ncbi:MAG: hypothetical protein LBV67_00665 [Streptococcaceae bacterium]|nr:hypothetical protein [Streptococcaceae bacterium]
MSQYIKEELKRAFLSRTTIATAFIAIILMVIGVTDSFQLDSYWLKHQSIFYLFVWGFTEGSSPYLLLLFPMISAIPFAASLISDSKSGMSKYIALRMERKRYLQIKFFINALVGGFVLMIGPLVGLIALLIMKIFNHNPMLAMEVEKGFNLSTSTGQLFFDIGIESVWLMIVILLANLFIQGMVFSTFALGMSTVIQNKYLTLVLPLGYLIFSGTVLATIHPNLYIVAIYNLSSLRDGIQWWLGSVLFYLSLGSILYVIGGKIIAEKYV